ncbi:MAG: hypothetical protein BV459_06845 [Thermoplasmata archaeon M11B2D]|nr:MAG: hypothetical protein BV459_06845 [Thermoplasmata archaeon M11B2D]
MARRSDIDIRYVGANDPTITEKSTKSEIIVAYNYYNYFYGADDAKKFVLAFLKSRKVPKAQLRKAQQIRPHDLITIGWNCRIMLNGGTLPDDIRKSSMNRLQQLMDTVVEEKKKKAVVKPKAVVSIQDHIRNKAGEYIADLEEQIDVFILKKKNNFDAAGWFQGNNIKPVVAKRIAEYYQPLYDEIYEASQGKDKELKEAFNGWKKAELKRYLEFIKSILSAAEVASVRVAKSRKPRKKKEKPAALVVAKVNYLEKDEDHNLQSIDPVNIVGANQLWVFNTKTRTLSVYNALGRSGLTVKGTTIVGFDDKTSITKKVRKPEVVLPKVLEGGKIVLRKLMGDIKAVEKNATGRINNTTILLRTIK